MTTSVLSKNLFRPPINSNFHFEDCYLDETDVLTKMFNYFFSLKCLFNIHKYTNLSVNDHIQGAKIAV
jgi:hypothetical protein